MLVPAIMITTTIGGLLCSLFPTIRRVESNMLAGHYLILVFSLALSSSLKLSDMGPDFLKIFLFLGLITLGSFLIHTLLSTLFGLDPDSTIITLTAGIYGPAFVPAVAAQLKNERIIPSGLICGSLGYAVGTLLGSLIYLLF